MPSRKTLSLIGGAAAIILIAWFAGRQLNRPSSTTVPATQQNASTATAPPIKAKALAPGEKTAPSTPIHEKAFLEEQLKTNPDHPPILLRLGEVEHSMGQLPEARKHLEQAVAADPTMLDARLELSLVCYELKDENEAQRQNLLVLKQDPKQVDALYNLGAISANRNDLADARRYWEDAVKYGADTTSGKNAASALSKLGPSSAQHAN